jgi:hypothetical protein
MDKPITARVQAAIKAGRIHTATPQCRRSIFPAKKMQVKAVDALVNVNASMPYAQPTSPFNKLKKTTKGKGRHF